MPCAPAGERVVVAAGEGGIEPALFPAGLLLVEQLAVVLNEPSSTASLPKLLEDDIPALLPPVRMFPPPPVAPVAAAAAAAADLCGVVL